MKSLWGLYVQVQKEQQKTVKKVSRNNYKIESLEPRLLMDASVNDWNDELNALNVGVYTIDSNSSKIDGLLVVSATPAYLIR